MTCAELLAELRRREVRLTVAGERIRYAGPEGAMTAALVAELAAHKSEILEHYRLHQWANPGGRMAWELPDEEVSPGLP
jgi:hypothetical protein